MRVLHFILDYPRWCLALSLALVVFFGIQLPYLQTNPSSYMLDRSHPDRVIDLEMADLFSGTGASITVMVKPDSGTVYQAALLHLVERLTSQFKRLNLCTEQDIETLRKLGMASDASTAVDAILQGGLQPADTESIDNLIQTLNTKNRKRFAGEIQFLRQLKLMVDPVARVRSITTAEDLVDHNDNLESVPLVEDIPQHGKGFEQLRRRVEENPMLLGTYVSKDHQATMIQIELNAQSDNAGVVGRARASVMDIVAGVEPGHSFSVGGSAVISSVLADYLKQDNERFFPLVLLVIVVILGVSFRSAEGVLITLLVAIVSLVSTLGLLPWLNIQQNMVTTMIPIFVMAASVADSIHFLTHFYRKLADNGQQVRSAIDATFRDLFRAMTFTSITTALGFLSLAFTDIVYVREFGIFVCFGVVFAYVYTLVLVPSILMLRLNRNAMKLEERQSLLASAVSASAQWLGGLSLRNKPAMVAMLLMLTCGSAYLAQQVRVDFEGIVLYPEDSQVRIDDTAIKQHFRGMTPLSIRLIGKEAGAVYSNEVIQYIDRVEQVIKRNPHVDMVLSPNSFLKRLDQVLRDGERDTLPSDMNSQLAAQFYLLYDNSSGQDIRDVADTGYQEGRIVVLFDTDRASVIRAAISEIKSIPVPEQIRVGMTDVAGLALAANDAIVHGQISSMGISAVLMFAIMALLFRSSKIGLIAIVPLGFTLLLNFAALRLLGMDLDIATSLISGIVLGISIDYGIHFIEAVLRVERQGLGRQAAIRQSLQEVSWPIIVNSLSLSAGFLVLTVSNLQPLVDLGLLIGMAMVVSALATLVILPLLLSLASSAAVPQLANTSYKPDAV